MKHLTFRSIEETGIAHAIYTPMGTGGWRLNEPEDLDNYTELGGMFGITPNMMVRTKQLHTTGVRVITADMAGEGVIRDVSAEGYDGMVTNVRKLMLCTVEADCVPVYLLDPVSRAVAMVHSGWKGTAGRISENAVNLMKETFGSRPETIIAAIGPCICRDCYEVSEDLIGPFMETFPEADVRRFFRAKDNGKYMLDLKDAVQTTLIQAGIDPAHIEDSGYCTFHSGQFYSWRRDADPDVRMLTAIWLA